MCKPLMSLCLPPLMAWNRTRRRLALTEPAQGCAHAPARTPKRHVLRSKRSLNFSKHAGQRCLVILASNAVRQKRGVEKFDEGVREESRQAHQSSACDRDWCGASHLAQRVWVCPGEGGGGVSSISMWSFLCVISGPSAQMAHMLVLQALPCTCCPCHSVCAHQIACPPRSKPASVSIPSFVILHARGRATGDNTFHYHKHNVQKQCRECGIQLHKSVANWCTKAPRQYDSGVSMHNRS